MGESLAFARDVKISGWTSVGDKLGGAYIGAYHAQIILCQFIAKDIVPVYDCAINTKEGTIIHAHKRYSEFAELHSMLRHTLPVGFRSFTFRALELHLTWIQYHQLNFLPPLPPKSPLARFRPTFIDRRRRLLQYWLASVLLHPEIGGSEPVRVWVMS